MPDGSAKSLLVLSPAKEGKKKGAEAPFKMPYYQEISLSKLES